MKKNTKKIFFGIIPLLLIIISLSFVLVAGQAAPTTGITPFDWTSQSYLYSNYGTNPTDMMPWKDTMCNNSEYMDFIVNIPLDSCSPAVVRSDLLEEQHVPVFCRLTGVKVNPLINVPYIKDIQVVQQDKPQDVLSITYYPPKAALSYSDYQYLGANSKLMGEQGKALGVRTMSNLGYVLIMLKQQPNENAMPKNVKINMTLKIFYDVAKTYGLGENGFVLPMLTENEWKLRYKEFSFWRGKGYLRLVELKDQTAKIAVYTNPTGNPIDYVTLKEGVQATQKEILLPGFYCGAGVRLNLDKITLPQNRAAIIVDGNAFTVDEGDMIGDTGCSLSKINLEQYGYGGKATIRCQADSRELQISNLEANISVGTKNFKITPGQKIPVQELGTEDTENLENWYVGYIGKEYAQRTTSDDELVPIGVENIVILFNYTKKTATIQDTNNINIVIKAFSIYLDNLHSKGGYITNRELILEGIKEISPSAFGIIKKSENIIIIFEGKNSNFDKINGEEVKLNSLSGPIQAAYSADTEDKYKSAINYYKEVSSKYSELKREDGANYGILALREAAELALKFNKEQDAIDLLNEITRKYGNSEDPEILSDVEKARQEITSRLQISGQNRQTISTLNGEHSFELIKFLKPGLNDISTELKINGISGTFTIGDRIGNDNEWEIESITDEGVTFRYIYSSTNTKSVSSKSKMIILDPFEQIKIETTPSVQSQPTIPENQIKVEFVSTNIKKEAEVSLDFESKRTSVTDFSIGIGIEKRAIQLNPDKTRSLISKLDSTISTINSINDKLGKLTTIWKKACLAGATALWVKNFADTITGEGYARRKAMEPWIKNCSDTVFRRSLDKNNEISISRCYQLMESKINSDVEIMEKALKETNVFIENVKSGKSVLRSSGLFGLTKTINEEEFMKSAQEKFPEELKNKIINEYTDGKSTGKTINTLYFSDNLSAYYTSDSLVSSTNLKEYILMLYIRKSCNWQNNGNSMLCTVDKEKELFDKISNLEKNLENKKALDKTKEGLKTLGINQRTIQTISAEKNVNFQTETFELNLEQIDSLGLKTISGYKQEDYFQKTVAIVRYIWPLGTKEYLLILAPAGSSENKLTYTIKEYYELDENNKIKGTTQADPKPPFGIVTKIDLSKCSRNVITAEDASKIKFWETGAYAGLVSVMPISRESGYYFATKGPSILETNTNSWKANGDVQTYYVCNVGPDKIISWSADGPTGDDASCCIEISNQVNLNNIDSVPVVPGQENNVNGKSESKRLIELAKGCTKKAIEEFGKGNRKIQTDCGTFNLGKPLTSGTGTNCEEFMSPTDCRIMYNLCDPVMCPSSRCDYGGRYPVENVIQSGIVGSLVLCSPNFENGKGVLMPVCLSGLNAGLDALNSVLKSSKDCLNEQLASGKTIGICDQIMSLYLCELMWKELDPFIKSGLPSIVQSTTQKGGGEYALFSESWKNSIDSARFFTNYYGVETFNSFKARSTAEVSTEVCKKFASIAYPTQGQFFSELTKVDSPPQVFASFQEISTGGVNGESHYKVYYHIYAGKDSGVFYSVYLKNPSSQGYYSVPETYFVKDSYGYLNKEQYKSSTPDFTAPSGYKELCVRINDKDICGFGQATTDFALDEANNLYIESQLGNEVTTAKACVSGTASLIPKVTLNIQQAVESMADPALYKTGIIRICSSTNPGGTDTTRYTNVGYCDNTEIKCWLDTNSVNNSISDLGIVNNILNSTIAAEIQKLIDSGEYKTKDQSIKDIQALETTYWPIVANVHTNILFYKQKLEKLYEGGKSPTQSELKKESEGLETLFDDLKIKLNELEPKLLVERNKAFYPEERAKADLLIAQTKALRAEMTGLLERFIAGRVISGEPGATTILPEFVPFSVWPMGKKIVHCWEDNPNGNYIGMEGNLGEKDESGCDVYPIGQGIIYKTGLYDDGKVRHMTGIISTEPGAYYIFIDHGNGLYSYYGNMGSLSTNIKEGQTIYPTDILGRGNSWGTGQSPTCSFYFKIFKITKGEIKFTDANNVNPLCFFDENLLNNHFYIGCPQIKNPEMTKSFLETSSICLMARNGLTIGGQTSGGETTVSSGYSKLIPSEVSNFENYYRKNAQKVINEDFISQQLKYDCGDFAIALLGDIIERYNKDNGKKYSAQLINSENKLTYWDLKWKSSECNLNKGICAQVGAEAIAQYNTISVSEQNMQTGDLLIYQPGGSQPDYWHTIVLANINKNNDNSYKFQLAYGNVDATSCSMVELFPSGENNFATSINSDQLYSRWIKDKKDTNTGRPMYGGTPRTWNFANILIKPAEEITTSNEKNCVDYSGETECNLASEGTIKCVFATDYYSSGIKKLCSKCPNSCSTEIKLPGITNQGSWYAWPARLLQGNDRLFTKDECGSGKISDNVCNLTCIWNPNADNNNGKCEKNVKESACYNLEKKLPAISFNLDSSSPCIQCPQDCTGKYSGGGDFTKAYFSSEYLCEKAEVECGLNCKWDGDSCENLGKVIYSDGNVEVQQKILTKAIEMEIPGNLALGLAYHEGGFKQTAKNENKDRTTGAIISTDYGVFQINNKYHCEYFKPEDRASSCSTSVTMICDAKNDTDCNIGAGLTILKDAKNWCDSQPGEKISYCNGKYTYSDWDCALRKYNGWSSSQSCTNENYVTVVNSAVSKFT